MQFPDEQSANTDSYCGKTLVFYEGCRGSLHRHLVKDETFMVSQGRFLIEFSDEEAPTTLQSEYLGENDVFHVPPGRWHRLTPVGSLAV